ncbi:MAG: flagellar assembly protein FliW [Longimicrobiales bacterium]
MTKPSQSNEGQTTQVTDVIEPRQIASRVLGEIQVTEEGTLTFPTGVLGFPEARDFTLVTTSREGFYWLQSLEHDTLTFLVMDPFLHVPDFSIEIDDEEMGVLGTEASEIIVLAVVTLPAGPDDSLTANLQGPLVINSAKGIGRQLILDDSPYGLRHTLDISAALLAS